MKKMFFLFVFVAVFFTGCNSVAEKDTLIARVGNENIYQEDIDFLPKRDFSNKGPSVYKSAVDNIFLSAALTSKSLSLDPSLESDWNAIYKSSADRMLFIAYYQSYMRECFGFTNRELKDYYSKNKSLFDDSLSFVEQRNSIAKKYYIENNQDSLKRFIASKIREKDIPMSVDVGFFLGDSVSTLNVADTVFYAHRRLVRQGQESYPLQDSLIISALFSDDSIPVGEIRRIQLKTQTPTFIALKIFDRTKRIEAKEEDCRLEFERAFIEQREEELYGTIERKMKENKKVVQIPIDLKNTEEFYEKHKDEYKTIPGFELYHAAMKDSAKLFAAMANANDLESFKNKAKEVSVKQETLEKDGFIGKVKKDYALPYGIGMIPTLFETLEGKSVGYRTIPFYSKSDSLFHVFYLSSIIPSEVKPYSRAKADVKAMLENDITKYDTSMVLITKNGKTYATHADVMRVFASIPELEVNKKNYDNVLKSLVQSAIFADDAKALNLDKSWEYRALARQVRKKYISTRYINGEKEKNQVKDFVPSDKVMKFVYYHDHALKGNNQTFEERKDFLKSYLVKNFEINYGVRLGSDLWESSNRHFFKENWNNYNPSVSVKSLQTIIDTAFANHDLETVIESYQKMLMIYTDNDSLYEHASYSWAQAFSDNDNFKQAIACYYAFEKTWPESPNAEKAMFSRGFILNENMHQNKEALAIFEDFQKKYPKSELKESVDWLIQNIKSDGKLAEDLVKKIAANDK